MSGGYSDPEVTEPAGETGGIRVTASTSMTEGECARLSTSIGSNCVTKLPRAPSPDKVGSVSLRLGHLRGKTILNRFLTRSGHFVTSRKEPKLILHSAFCILHLRFSVSVSRALETLNCFYYSARAKTGRAELNKFLRIFNS